MMRVDSSATAGMQQQPQPQPLPLHSRSQLRAALQSQPVTLERSDAIQLALSYSLSQKSLQEIAATTTVNGDEKQASDENDVINGGQARHRRQFSSSSSLSTFESDRFTRATVLRPLIDYTSFIPQCTHLDPNARFEIHERAILAMQASPTAASATTSSAAASSSNAEEMPGPRAGEDEDDFYWREKMIAQSMPGTKTYIRQMYAKKSERILVDRDGQPMDTQNTNATTRRTTRGTERNAKLHSTRLTKRVNPSTNRAASHQQRRFPNRTAADSDAAASTSTIANYVKPATHSIATDALGFVRGLLPKDESSSDRSIKKSPTATSVSTRHNRSSGSDASLDLLTHQLSRLNYEYEYEDDETPLFFHAKYQPASIHPQWLKEREDFKCYASGNDERKEGGKKTMKQSKSTPALKTPHVTSASTVASSTLVASKAVLESSKRMDAMLAGAKAKTHTTNTNETTPISTAQKNADAASTTTPTSQDLLALHAAEKPVNLRSARDSSNILHLLNRIEYFSRLPLAVRTGLAELVQLQRAVRGETLHTRIHGTKFVYVYSGSVVSSASMQGDEFTRVRDQTEQVKKRIEKERKEKQEEEDKKKRKIKTKLMMMMRGGGGGKANSNTTTATEDHHDEKEDHPTDNIISRAAQRFRGLKTSESRRSVTFSPETASSSAGEAEAGATTTSSAITNTTSKTPSSSPQIWNELAHASLSAVRASNSTNGTGILSPKSVVTQTLAAAAAAKAQAVAKAAQHSRSSSKILPLSSSTSSSSRVKLLNTPQSISPAVLAILNATSNNASREIRGFQIGTKFGAFWSPNTRNLKEGGNMNADGLLLLSPTANKRSSFVPLSPTNGSSNKRFTFPTADPSTSLPPDHVTRLGLVFHRILPSTSLFGSNELFENTYAGLSRITEMKSYQMRLTRLLSNTMKKRQSSGWIKLKTMLHNLITAREKSPLDSVIAYQPCILLTWNHKDLEKLVLQVKEQNLHHIITHLNYFRESLFESWSYKQLLHLSTTIELKEFVGGTVLFQQGKVEKEEDEDKEEEQKKKEGDEKEVFTTNTAKVLRIQRRTMLNHNHNPSNHHIYLLTSGMLQLQKTCVQRTSQRWPESKNTWEISYQEKEKTFFAGFIRGKEIVGGETILGLQERDFTVSVPKGQTATCILIKRNTFELLQSQRILHAIHAAVVRLRDLARATIDARITLRNHETSHAIGVSELGGGGPHSLKPATRKVGSESAQEYLLHVLKDDMKTLEKNEPQIVSTAGNSDEASSSSPDSSARPSSSSIRATIMPSSSNDILSPSSKTIRIDAHQRLEDLIRLSADAQQAAKEQRVRMKQAKLKAASEQIILDVKEASASVGGGVSKIEEERNEEGWEGDDASDSADTATGKRNTTLHKVGTMAPINTLSKSQSAAVLSTSLGSSSIEDAAVLNSSSSAASLHRKPSTNLRKRSRLPTAAVLEQAKLAEQKRALHNDIQTKLAAYDARLRTEQIQKEAEYAQKLVEISKSLQVNMNNPAFFQDKSNPILKHLVQQYGDMSDSSAIVRLQMKVKQLIQQKRGGRSITGFSPLTSPHASSSSSQQQPTFVHLTEDDLLSLDLTLPPRPSSSVEDLTAVSRDIWKKHIRYLTDLEADQRIVFGEYMLERRSLDSELKEHDVKRIELLNKKFIKGLLGDVYTIYNSNDDAAAGPSEHDLERIKQDEEWKRKQEYDMLNQSMLVMGVAGDEDAQHALMEQQRGSVQTLSAVSSSATELNENLKENLSFSNAILDSHLKPLEMDALSISAKSLTASSPSPITTASSNHTSSSHERDVSPLKKAIDPRVLMSLQTSEKPPLTDLKIVKPKELGRTETHSSVVSHDIAPQPGSQIGLYFASLPVPSLQQQLPSA